MGKRIGDFFNLGWDETERAFNNLTEKQWLILNAALKVFTEKGYSATTTSEIAKVAGIAEGTIFRHFKRKKDILLTLLIPMLYYFVGPNAANSLNKIIIENEQMWLEDLLVLILQNRYQIIVENQALIRLIITEAQYHPELKKALVESVVSKTRDFFIRVIDIKKRQGEILPEVDSWTAVRSLFGMLVIFAVSQGLLVNEIDKRNVEQEIRAMVRIFLQGVKAQ